MKKSEEAARRVHRKLIILEFRKADLGLFRDVLPEIWLLFRDHLLQDQKAAHPQDLGKNTRKSCSCVNKQLLDKLKTKQNKKTWKLRENGNKDR